MKSQHQPRITVMSTREPLIYLRHRRECAIFPQDFFRRIRKVPVNQRFPRVILITICIALVSSACVTAEERDARRQAEYQAYMSQLKDRCTQYGNVQGTESFAQSMQSESRAAEARAVQEKAARDKSSRELQCLIGNVSFCDNRPQTTDCTKDLFGNVHCETRP